MGKVVIITGASAGMGAVTAKHLSDRGFQVYGASRRAQTGQKNSHFTELKMDVADEQSVADAVAYVMREAGRIDVLVNNAGISLIGSIEDTSNAEAKGVFETNVFGLMNVCRAVLPHMREASSGRIINISSIAGVMGLPYRGIYSASKAAVIAITEAMSAELKEFGIVVSAILPGDFKTSINEHRKVVEGAAESAYREQTTALSDLVTEEVATSADPILIAQAVEKMISQPNPSLIRMVGAPLQKLSTKLHFLLPGRWFERIIRSHYKMK